MTLNDLELRYIKTIIIIIIINQVHTTKHKTYEIIHFIKGKYVRSLYAKLQGSTPQSFSLVIFLSKVPIFCIFLQNEPGPESG